MGLLRAAIDRAMRQYPCKWRDWRHMSCTWPEDVTFLAQNVWCLVRICAKIRVTPTGRGTTRGPQRLLHEVVSHVKALRAPSR